MCTCMCRDEQYRTPERKLGQQIPNLTLLACSTCMYMYMQMRRKHQLSGVTAYYRATTSYTHLLHEWPQVDIATNEPSFWETGLLGVSWLHS